MASTSFSHPALAPGRVAVITGGASGLGFAAAQRFAGLGMKVCIADLPGERLDKAKAALGGAAMAAGVDVSRREELERLEGEVRAAYGAVDVLMNNAGIHGTSMFSDPEAWRRVIEVNLWGIINGSQVFGPHMIAQSTPGLIINTGSKQGITTPPGDPAYNVSKAGVKVFTEALQHELRNTEGCKVSAHLFIPGFVFTGLTARGRTEKPEGAWTPEQTVDFMLKSVDAGDFYILCPDNDVTRQMDERRILWAAGDIAENRPPLSRWHKDYGEAFAAFLKG
ncbi:SDR family NAD(P)-dependent oxidoreductase [Aquabacter sp. CN5-332]|uniref:SDR family NAD(P)-dependent oxidoreductase n=1 Tax=Aquabacter sp. CN5-332 TaxID=3156608 RepID=UPI0032B3A95C